jgi:hypothetical protein
MELKLEDLERLLTTLKQFGVAEFESGPVNRIRRRKNRRKSAIGECFILVHIKIRRAESIATDLPDFVSRMGNATRTKGNVLVRSEFF